MSEREEKKKKRKDGGVEAPLSLGGLFGPIDMSDDDDDDKEEGKEKNNEQFQQIYDEQILEIGCKELIIRQYCWHQVNANKVWPGTFNLAEFIEIHSLRYHNGIILELGAATGALAIYMKSIFSDYQLYTSDIDDGGEVQNNIQYNFIRNGE